ncbi:MAG: type IV secretory system conjugative DNA transfer family protein [Nitrospira sp.]|nr:type IV secretory system conjugative DNA transfer family protein [Nitrospira sp.]
MSTTYNNAVGPQVRAPHPKPGLVIPFLACASLVFGLQAATQFFAATFNYQDVLGDHFGGLYQPWAILEWASRWRSDYPLQLRQSGGFGMIVAASGLLCLTIARTVQASRPRSNPFLHGSARWANRDDIEAAALLPRTRTVLDWFNDSPHQPADGVYVGGWVDANGTLHYLRHSGPEHVLTYAPTRSGKGVGLVIPTLLSWPHSALIADLKGELWELTAGWRQHHAKNQVLRFEPAAAQGTVRWNPLDEVRLGTEHEVADVQNLATILVDPDGRGLESHWQKTSQALLVGVMLHALYQARQDGTTTSLPAVDRMLADPQRPIAELWKEMTTYGHVNGQVHPVVGAAARDMLDRPEEEAGSVLSSAKSYLALYRDPLVAHNVSASEFKIRDLMHHPNPVSLYLVTKPNDKARLRPLIRVFVAMAMRLLTDTSAVHRETVRPSGFLGLLARLGIRSTASHLTTKPAYAHRLLGMLDEFPSLGKLEIFQESLAFMAGYGLKFYLICQDINQLRSRETGYGADEAISSNCHIQNAFPPNRLETAEHLSRLTGQTTVIQDKLTVSRRRMSAIQAQESRSQHEVQRPLLTPDECLRMPGPKKDAQGQILEAGDMVIYVAGFPAIYGRQPLFFQDPIFAARAAIAPPAVSDRLCEPQVPHPIKIEL